MPPAVACGKAVVARAPAQTSATPTTRCSPTPQWFYVRGFSNFQFGYASALAVLLFVVAALFLVLAPPGQGVHP